MAVTVKSTTTTRRRTTTSPQSGGSKRKATATTSTKKSATKTKKKPRRSCTPKKRTGTIKGISSKGAGKGDVYKNRSQTSRPGPNSDDPLVQAAKVCLPQKRGRKVVNVDTYQAPAGLHRDPCAEKIAKMNLQVVCNPWMEVDQPKFPDGKAQWSVGRKFRFAEEVKPFNKGEMLIALFAAVNNFAWAVSLRPTVPGAVVPSPIQQSMVVLSNHTAEAGIEFQVTYTAPTDGNESVLDIEPAEKSYMAWRPVSVGLRMRSLNTDDEDEGWWEAIRTTRESVIGRWGPVVPNNGQPVTNNDYESKKTHMCNILPLRPGVDFLEQNVDWSSNPTFCTGKLTHLQHYDFQLNFVREDNEFIPLEHRQLRGNLNLRAFKEFPNQDLQSFVRGKYVLNHPIFTADDRVAMDPMKPETWLRRYLISDAMDVILIRVHSSPKARLYMESVMNQEVLVPHTGAFSQYMTPTAPKRDTLSEIIRARNDNYLLPYQRTRRKLR